MVEYKVTVVVCEGGVALPEAVAQKCEAHLTEMAADGWRLVHVDRNAVAVPNYWTFFWERSALLPGGPASWVD